MFSDPGFERSTVQDPRKRKNTRQDTGFDRYLGSMFCQNLGMECSIRKESSVWGRYICSTEVWDAGLSLKRSRIAGSGPPSRPCVTFTLTLMLLLMFLLQFVLHYLLLLVFLSMLLMRSHVSGGDDGSR